MQAGTNYLYIIFAVVYVIYSIIKATKKVTNNRPTTSAAPDAEESYTSPKTEEFKPVQAPTSSPVPERIPGDDLKKMLEDLMGGGSSETKTPEEQVPQPKQQHQPEKTRPVQPALHHMEHPKIISHTFDKAKSPVVHAKPVAPKPAKISRTVLAEQVSEEEPEMEFDVRQAIIFSEILKRPQY